MTLDWITTALSEDAPAGPDLWETDDPAFNEYYFDATARLPEADDYAKIGLAMGDDNKLPDSVFDPKSVLFTREATHIDGMLKRSRDLRLLALRAQWSMLAGEIDETAASVTAMADVLEEIPIAVHPVIDGTPRERLEAINDLCAVGAMILPLRYLDIGGTGTSRRRMMVARGEMTAHDGEDDLSIDAMIGAISKSRDSVTQTHAALTAFRAAVTRIEIACLSHPTPHTPQLKKLSDEIEAVLAIIVEAEPDFDASPKDMAAEGAGTTSDATGAGEEVAPSVSIATEVKSHDEARRRLTAVETYFGTNEPSSAAVLLVTQSRLLIGKSLVDAFDILMPESAQRAAVDFISDSGFKLAHQQLRELADQVLVEGTAPPAFIDAPSPPESVEEEAPREGTDRTETDVDPENTGLRDQPAEDAELESASVPQQTQAPVMSSATAPSFYVADAGVASSQILAVETYFRAKERSSPIPMLLARARSYIGKDFETLLKELVPKIDH